MNYYDYKGIQNGKYAQGEIEAINKDEAAYKLRGQKVIITSLEKSTKHLPFITKNPIPSTKNFFLKSRISF